MKTENEIKERILIMEEMTQEYGSRNIDRLTTKEEGFIKALKWVLSK